MYAFQTRYLRELMITVAATALVSPAFAQPQLPDEQVLAAATALDSPAFAQSDLPDDLSKVQVVAAADVPTQVAAAEGAPTQVAAAETTANAPQVERVVITARRREEDAQDVPVSASVVTGFMLNRTPTFHLQQPHPP